MTERSLFENPTIERGELSASALQKILSLQGSILQQAVVRSDYSVLLDELCLMAESFTPNAVAAVMLYDPSTETLRVENGPSLSDEAVDAFNGLRAGEGSCGNAIYHREAMYVCNTLEDARWERISGIAKRFGICSCFSFPILDASEQPVGSFSISSFCPRSPRGFHRALLEACTSICGVILQRREDEQLRRRLLDEQIRNERVESLGILAGGFAHDFNNLLTAIMGNVDLAAAETPDGPIGEGLQLAMKAIERASGLTGQLLAVAKGGSLVRTPMNIATIIRDSTQFSLHGSNVSFEITGIDELPSPIVRIDGGQVGQLIQNLVINARQAMPNGGVVRIHCEIASEQRSTESDRLSSPVKTERQLRITVSDTGEGMAKETLEHAFEPYYTTREKGSGLGLFLSYSIAKRHGGRIEVTSERGEGTRFTVYLPWEEGCNAAKPVDEDQVSGIRANVLVMDDDPLVRRTLARMLGVLGCSVVEADDGLEALVCYKKAMSVGQAVDVTILDLTVPGGMGGVEAKDELKKLDRHAKVIVTSGYSVDEACTNYGAAGFDGVISKPYTFAELKRVLSSVIALSR